MQLYVKRISHTHTYRIKQLSNYLLSFNKKSPSIFHYSQSILLAFHIILLSSQLCMSMCICMCIYHMYVSMYVLRLQKLWNNEITDCLRIITSQNKFSGKLTFGTTYRQLFVYEHATNTHTHTHLYLHLQ